MIGRVTACGIATLLAALAQPSPARAAQPAAATLSACGSSVPLVEPIARASARFGVPTALIRSVIAAESNFVVSAVSSKGAMGLMQLMPETWNGLRLRYALGVDPFDPRDNIFAGTAYLRELLDRYGDPGFLAAYNAGPGRYEAYLAGARPLPAETVAYVARLSSATLGGGTVAPAIAVDPEPWRRASLFTGATDQPASAVAEPEPSADARPAASPVDTIFVRPTGSPK